SKCAFIYGPRTPSCLGDWSGLEMRIQYKRREEKRREEKRREEKFFVDRMHINSKYLRLNY
ncbi:hypothetical protein, partial [Neisseria gonorrhoeae]|uniref:hypothetical protein n=1 Tax=Neisseria gonorrhoeae TaxID=485 RepID=UPI001C850E62